MITFQPSAGQTGLSPASRWKPTLKEGRELAKERRFDEALAVFESLLEQGEASSVIHMAIGRIKFQQRQLEEAIKHFHTAVRLAPTDASLYIRLARAYLAQGKLELAEENFQNAAGLDPKSTSAYLGIGQVYLRQGKFQEAVAQYEKALRFEPRSILARRGLANAYMQLKKRDEAFSQMKAALRIEPKNHNVHRSLGNLYMTVDEYSNARRAFETAIELAPEPDSRLRMDLAESLIASDKLGQAEDVLSKVTTTRGRGVPARFHQQWGNLYHRRGMYPEAVEEYRAAALALSETQSEMAEVETWDAGSDKMDDAKWKKFAESYRETFARFRKEHNRFDDPLDSVYSADRNIEDEE